MAAEVKLPVSLMVPGERLPLFSAAIAMNGL
jgi:hypothetical protein